MTLELEKNNKNFKRFILIMTKFSKYAKSIGINTGTNPKGQACEDLT